MGGTVRISRWEVYTTFYWERPEVRDILGDVDLDGGIKVIITEREYEVSD
jgi:hypothetical protein